MSKTPTPTTDDSANPRIVPLDIQPILDAGRALGTPLASMDAGHGRKTEPCVIIPEGYTIAPLALRPELPDRVHATVVFDDLDSFTAYVNRFKTPETLIFANRRSAQVCAVIDYHKGSTPEACVHRVGLIPSLTDEWTAWMGCNNKPMSQEQFARFLEEWASNIAEPDSATMLEVASSLEATKAVRFKSSKRLSDGQREFQYVEDVQGQVAKGTMVIPEKFVVGIRRLRSDYEHKITCRFRWRVAEEGLTLFYQMDRLDILLDELTDCMARSIKSETEIEPLFVPDEKVGSARV